MGIKSITLAAITLILSTSVNATILVEDFSDPFPQWESGWLGLNSNIQNYWGPGSAHGGGFLIITDGDAEPRAGETVEINFENTFGLSLTSFSIYIDTGVNTSIKVYDGSDGIMLDAPLSTSAGSENIYISSTSGISGFSLFSDSQIEGNTRIDNVVVTTGVVPVPAAVWLFGSGLLGLIGVARRKVRV